MITFTVTIHGPFHISAGESGDGADNVVDRDNPLPASSLKGLMRAAAADLLGLPDTLIADVFGAPGPAGSPWRWSDGRVAAPEFGRYARIKVDPAGRVERGFLAIGENVWSTHATFEVTPLRRMPDEQATQHRLVLRACGRGVSALGGHRRRGSGWVSITDDQEWTPAHSSALIALRGGVG